MQQDKPLFKCTLQPTTSVPSRRCTVRMLTRAVPVRQRGSILPQTIRSFALRVWRYSSPLLSGCKLAVRCRGSCVEKADAGAHRDRCDNPSPAHGCPSNTTLSGGANPTIKVCSRILPLLRFFCSRRRSERCSDFPALTAATAADAQVTSVCSGSSAAFPFSRTSSRWWCLLSTGGGGGGGGDGTVGGDCGCVGDAQLAAS